MPCKSITKGLAGLAAAAMLVASPLHPGARAAEHELKFGVISAAATPLYAEIITGYAKAIESASQGRIAIDLRPQGGFGPPIELLSQLEAGKVDMIVTLPSYYPGRFPRTSVMELPTVFENAETGSRIVWKLYEEGLISADFANVKVLGLFTSAPFGIFVAERDINTLRDLRGMRVRVSGGTVGLAFARLGLVPLGLPTNLLGPALDQKWVDALSFGFDTAKGTPGKPPGTILDQVVTVIDARFSAPSQMIIMSKRSYEALPRDLQAVIDGLSGAKLSLAIGRARDATEDATRKSTAADPRFRMIEFSPDDRAEIARRITPVFDEWATGLRPLGIDGGALLRRARDLANQVNS